MNHVMIMEISIGANSLGGLPTVMICSREPITSSNGCRKNVRTMVNISDRLAQNGVE